MGLCNNDSIFSKLLLCNSIPKSSAAHAAGCAARAIGTSSNMNRRSGSCDNKCLVRSPDDEEDEVEGEADSKSASNESDEAEDDEDAETADDGEKKMSSTLLAVLATAALAILMATPIGNPCVCGN